jgi:hypothetical protein
VIGSAIDFHFSNHRLPELLRQQYSYTNIWLRTGKLPARQAATFNHTHTRQTNLVIKIIKPVKAVNVDLLLAHACETGIITSDYQWWFYVGAGEAQAPTNLVRVPKFLCKFILKANVLRLET